MVVSTARNIGALASIESIKGTRIPEADLEFLIRETACKKVLSVEIPERASDFSKSKHFFLENRTKFMYLHDGHLIPSDAIDARNEYFIAFKIRKKKMFVYGYFPGEAR